MADTATDIWQAIDLLDLLKGLVHEETDRWYGDIGRYPMVSFRNKAKTTVAYADAYCIYFNPRIVRDLVQGELRRLIRHELVHWAAYYILHRDAKHSPWFRAEVVRIGGARTWKEINDARKRDALLGQPDHAPSPQAGQ